MEQYDALADRYLGAKEKYLKNYADPAEEFVLEHIGDGAGRTLLDIGCGAGEEARGYEQRGFAVRGVDPSEEMLKRARDKATHPENFYTGSYEKTGAKDQSVDVVVGLYSFHYVENLDEGYGELARILRPGGTLVFAVRHPFSDLSEAKRFLKNGKEYVRPTVYMEVPIEHPLHTMGEYFS